MDIPVRKTRAIVDLDTIAYNIRLLWKRAGEDVDFLVLLKADSYGHGNVAVGALSEELGVYAGGIAALEEAAFLRERGIQLPLFMLEDLFADEVEAALDLDVMFTVSSLEYARTLSAAAQKRGTTARVHVNVDTGMGRLGMRSEEAAALIEKIYALPSVSIEGIYTHFPISDGKDKKFSYKQLAHFESLLQDLIKKDMRPQYVHAANSGAVLDFPGKASFSLIRPGVSTFGMYPSPDVDHRAGIVEAMTLKSAFIKVARYPSGSSIGYGRTFITKRPSVIGVLPIGYGDGYVRDYSNNAEVVVHGKRVPVVGRVSMDMITVDLTDLPERVKVGDEAVLMGTQEWKDRSASVSSEELARWAGTITYEVTCLFGKRVPRVFVRNGEVVGVESLNSTYNPKKSGESVEKAVGKD
jgi:alanine racemase